MLASVNGGVDCFFVKMLPEAALEMAGSDDELMHSISSHLLAAYLIKDEHDWNEKS